MRVLIVFWTALAIGLLVSCKGLNANVSNSDFDNRLASVIRNECDFAEPCSVRIDEAMRFDWDQVYVFAIGQTPVDVNAVLGKRVPFEREFSRKIVFLNGEEVVRTDENRPDLERMLPGEIFFSDGRGEKSYYVFPRSA